VVRSGRVVCVFVCVRRGRRRRETVKERVPYFAPLSFLIFHTSEDAAAAPMAAAAKMAKAENFMVMDKRCWRLGGRCGRLCVCDGRKGEVRELGCIFF